MQKQHTGVGKGERGRGPSAVGGQRLRNNFRLNGTFTSPSFSPNYFFVLLGSNFEHATFYYPRVLNVAGRIGINGLHRGYS